MKVKYSPEQLARFRQCSPQHVEGPSRALPTTPGPKGRRKVPADFWPHFGKTRVQQASKTYLSRLVVAKTFLLQPAVSDEDEAPPPPGQPRTF